MRRFALASLLAVSSLWSDARAADDNTVWAYQQIFATTTNLNDILPIVRRVRVDESLRQDAVLDYMAELSVSRAMAGLAAARTADSAAEEFAHKEMVESLGRYGGRRYDTTMRTIAMSGSSAGASARMFVKGTVDRKTPQYKPGTIDLAAMRARMAIDALASPLPTDAAAQHLSELPLDSSIDEVIARFGRPQAVAGRIWWKQHRVPVELTRFHTIIFFYRGLGRVVFYDRRKNKGDWRAKSIYIEPLAFEDFMPYRGDPAKYGQPDAATLAMLQLLSGDSVTLRYVIDNVEDEDSASVEFMDTAAEVLLAQRTVVMDKATADGYAWICVLLRRDGGPRYVNVLATVAAATPAEHLRKHAEGAVEQGRHPELAPYVPGSISLDTQRAKYPSIYPQRTFHARKP